MATSRLAMNAVFGRFVDVLPIEAAEAAAFEERNGLGGSSSTVKEQVVGPNTERVFNHVGFRARSRASGGRFARGRPPPVAGLHDCAASSRFTGWQAAC